MAGELTSLSLAMGRGVVGPPLPLALHSRISFGGDSNYQGGNFGVSIIGSAIEAANGMVIPLRFANQAVAGRKTSGVLSNITQITNLQAQICSLNVGRNNIYDITTGANKATILAGMKSDCLAIWSAILDPSTTYQRVLHNTMIHRPISAAWTQLMEDAATEFDAWLWSQNGSMGGRVKIVDFSNASTGFVITEDSMPDQQHLNYRGAYKFGKVVGAAIRSLIDNVDPYWQNSSDFGSILLSTSRDLTGTSGTPSSPVTGLVANGCVVRIVAADTTGISVVCDKGTDEAGRNTQKITVNADPSAVKFSVLLFVPAGTGSWFAGMLPFAKMRCRMSSVANIEKLSAGTWRNTSNNTSTAIQSYNEFSYTGSDPAPDTIAGMGPIASDDLAVCNAVLAQAASATWLWAVAKIDFDAGGGSGLFEFSRPTLMQHIT